MQVKLIGVRLAQITYPVHTCCCRINFIDTTARYIEQSNIPCRPAILVLPGGGYSFCSDREADPVAAPFLKAGYQVFILRYSVGSDATWPNPLDDYEQAMETIVTYIR